MADPLIGNVPDDAGGVVLDAEVNLAVRDPGEPEILRAKLRWADEGAVWSREVRRGGETGLGRID